MNAYEEFRARLGDEAMRVSEELARNAPRFTDEQRHALAILLKRPSPTTETPGRDTDAA